MKEHIGPEELAHAVHEVGDVVGAEVPKIIEAVDEMMHNAIMEIAMKISGRCVRAFVKALGATEEDEAQIEKHLDVLRKQMLDENPALKELDELIRKARGTNAAANQDPAS